MNISRKIGFKFNEVIVNSTNDIFMTNVQLTQSPSMRYASYTSPNRNGARYSTYGYDDKQAIVTIAIWSKDIATRRKKQRDLLSQICGKEGRLIFLDEPTLFYNARQYDAIEVSEDECMTMVTIPFICSYCAYELYNDFRDDIVNNLTMTVNEMGVLVNRATWQDITDFTIKQIDNKGNYEAQPLIEIRGTASLITLETNNKEFSIANIVDDIIFVDSESMNVYRIVDGRKVSVLPQFKGLFPTIAVGESDVYIGGSDLNVEVTVDFKNTYIV